VVKPLYKPEGCWFQTGWCELIFLIYLILSAALSLKVLSATKRSDYQKQKDNVAG
jgi:hypothetical protein